MWAWHECIGIRFANSDVGDVGREINANVLCMCECVCDLSAGGVRGDWGMAEADGARCRVRHRVTLSFEFE